uniref:Replication protein n=1 Tax=Kalanchoe fedtschenkoi TaxID=63787 RepID=A0A7N0UNL0_KALFE
MKKISQIEKVLQVDEERLRKTKTVREFILVTLIHAENRPFTDTRTIISRVRDLFQCRAIAIAKEVHKSTEGDDSGEHFHIGIWAMDASKNNLRKKIRSLFPEWKGRAIGISVHKGWGSICRYITKEDQKPIVWGEFTQQQILSIAEAHKKKKAMNLEIGNLAILKKIEELEDWYQVYRDDILANRVLNHLPRMKEAYEDFKIVKDIESNVFSRIIDYLEAKGNPQEYDVEEIREKSLVIDWIACQLCFKRPLKTKQLFIYGEPSTQKTLLMSYLSKVIKVYFASSRKNDFAGANDYYDLWVFDEFHEQEQAEDQTWNKGYTAEGSDSTNNLLKVLDGQECRLDAKYAKIFKKKRKMCPSL